MKQRLAEVWCYDLGSLQHCHCEHVGMTTFAFSWKHHCEKLRTQTHLYVSQRAWPCLEDSTWFSLLTYLYLCILRWRLWPIQGPTGACGWAPSFNLRPFTLQARPQSSPPHPQSFSPMAPLMSNSPFWTLTQTTWIYTASGALTPSKIMHLVQNRLQLHRVRFDVEIHVMLSVTITKRVCKRCMQICFNKIEGWSL